jgi:hypothetical protein
MWGTPPAADRRRGARIGRRHEDPDAVHAPAQGQDLVDGPDLRIREKADTHTSYAYQLEAFRDAVVAGGPNITDSDAAVVTMQTIDDIYRAAGMEIRQPS